MDQGDRGGGGDRGRSPSESRWWWWIVGVVALGTAVRAVYVLVVLEHVRPGLDAVWYTLQGGSIRHGTGYVVPTSLFQPPVRPTAGFPPLYPAYQAAWQLLFGGGPTSVRLAGLVPGAVTVVCTALLGRRLAGDRVGLLAALVVALDPVLVAVDGSTMSENLSVPLTVLAVLLALGVTRQGVAGRAGLARAAALGAVCGLAALTRQDLVVLLPGLVVAGALTAGGPWRRRSAAAALGLAAAAALLVPWAARNHDEVGTFAISTLSPTSALAGANCERTYSGRSIGSWEFSCVAAAQDTRLDEAGQASAYQHAATSYATAHAERWPVVVAAREARVWGFWAPGDQLPREAEESRRHGWQALAYPLRILLVVLGAWGLAGLVRRDHRAWPVLAPVAVAALSGAISHGNPRFSSIAAPVLAVGAASLAARLVARRRRGTVGPPSVAGAAPA